jgi:hypothetical protein
VWYFRQTPASCVEGPGSVPEHGWGKRLFADICYPTNATASALLCARCVCHVRPIPAPGQPWTSPVVRMSAKHVPRTNHGLNTPNRLTDRLNSVPWQHSPCKYPVSLHTNGRAALGLIQGSNLYCLPCSVAPNKCSAYRAHQLSIFQTYFV